MKLVAKILKLTSILIISALFVLFSLSLIMQNKVAGILLRALNNNFSTKIETGSYRLSLIKKFPNASVELKDVLVFSSPEFDMSGFTDTNTDTLLSAKSVSIDFKMIDMLRKAYTFTRINIRSGSLNLFTDKSGKVNYKVSKDNNAGGADNVTLNLNRINLSDVKFNYYDHRVDLIIKGIFKYGNIKSKIQGSNIDLDGDSRIIFNFFRLRSFSIKNSIPATLQIGLNQNNKGIFFRKSIMRIENWDFILNGFIASDNYLDLNITADNIDISKIAGVLPSRYQDAISDYNPRGILKFDWKIKGKSSAEDDLHFDIAWSMNNARVENRKSDLKIDGFSFSGLYTNGTGNKPETSSLFINDFSTRLGSADYKGSFSVQNFTNPRAELTFKGKLIMSELREFLDMKNVNRAEGSVDFDIKFSGSPGKTNSFKFRDVFNLSSQSEVVFNSAGISFSNKPFDISGMNGRMIIYDNTITNNLRFSLNNHKTTISAKLRNFPGWLVGNSVMLTGDASVSSSILRPESFMGEGGTDSNSINDKKVQTAVKFPDDINLDINFKFDTLIYKTFYAGNISGTLSIMPGIMNFRTMSLNTQEGFISGNGLVVQNPDKTFIGRGSYSLKGVDVNEAFRTFNNFGQNFLTAENIAGTLSGNITLVLPADSLLNPNVRSVTAEGNYNLTNGALIDFEPVEALSSFIELSELENIRFEKLENDFFIRDNVFYMPQTEIKSSAVDLSVNGFHSFDNKYEYHVKMLLSEILSNKARKNKKLSDEFGEVEDDGLGRTSVFLKITGNGEVVDVSYDMKAAGNQIKENIKKEKQNLKKIFNEEYGLYKENPEQENKESSRPRFRIEWEGLDSTSAEEKPVIKRKESLLDRILRKN